MDSIPFVLSGLFAGAAAYHLLLWAQDRRDPLPAAFAADCALRAAAVVTSAADSTTTLHVAICLDLLAFVTWVACLALLAKLRDRRAAWVLATAFVLVALPAALGVPPDWWYFAAVALALLAGGAFGMFCVARVWRRDRSAGPVLFGSAALVVITFPVVAWAGAVAWVGAVAWLIARANHRTRAQLAASEARLAAVVNYSPGVAVQWYDGDGRVVLWNAASEAMFGFAAGEAVGQTLDRLIHTPDEYRVFLDTLAEIRRTGKPIPPTEYTFRRRSGETGVCLSTIFRIPGPGGGDWFACVDVDITARKQAEEAVRESEARLARLTATMPHALYVFDLATQTTVFTNREVWVGLGYTEAEIARLGPGFMAALLHPDDLARVPALLARWETARDGEVLEVDYRLRTAAGAWRWFHGRDAVYARDPAGRVTQIIGTVLDLTDRIAAEDARRALAAQLAQAQRTELVGRLAGGIAHDFNNLLTVINGYAEFLQSAPLAPDQRAMLAGVADAGARAAALTGQLLAFSRQQVVEPRVLDLNAVVRDAEALLGRLLGEDVRLVAALADPPPRVRADAGQLGQVVVNLAVNARDAMPTGGTVTVTTAVVEVGDPPAGAAAGRYAVLAVADTGAGMPADVRDRVFEPFFTTKAVGQGTGLGLATVRAVAEECGGFVRVASAPGRGSTFEVCLPAVDLPPAPPAAPPAPAAGGRETLLLVEDDADVHALTRTMLRRAGYTVLAAGGAVEALRVARDHPGPIDLLVTDVVMPEVGGRELAGLLAAVRPGVPVLYVSGYTADAVLRHGVREADVAFLQKPFTADALAAKVREALAARPASPARQQ